ncbi:SatD family protein [Synoicihabitans lomoniglobus]|uniref:SatD family protein n=1 Tax=Synoicihabitans lomoniglobus TaxID=2909285 RepID=A0AAF0I4Z8_9BACT|nr:SatD family protein [Opitutaceae bacterium LMO-M01]WED66765.1 SatD family protein [Opitutaceae bacterium LMO-M01]
MTHARFILMADVIASGDHASRPLSTHLKAMVKAVNLHLGKKILSPLTVTLGDEFQGICDSAVAGVGAMLWLEHYLRQKPLRESPSSSPYQLRYVLHEGAVETPLNRERAHGMLGPGLTLARRRLEAHRRGAPRIQIALTNETLSRRLQDLFGVLDTLSQDFKVADYALIEGMMKSTDSESLARRFERHRTSIDRRRRTLKIDACLTLERLLLDLADSP